MIKFSPSILAADFNCLGAQVAATRAAGVPWVHLDVMDGAFVPSISFGMPVIRSLRGRTDQFFDVHLMVEDPIRYIRDFADCGADRITFHLEACENAGRVIDAVRGQGLEVGLAIRPGTPVEETFPLLPRLDMLLVMTVEPGFGGQKYIEASTGRIRMLRKYLKGLGLEKDIQVDGGITRSNVEKVLDAGANVIVAGSAVYRGDAEENAEYFMEVFRNRPEGCLEYRSSEGIRNDSEQKRKNGAQ